MSWTMLNSPYALRNHSSFIRVNIYRGVGISPRFSSGWSPLSKTQKSWDAGTRCACGNQFGWRQRRVLQQILDDSSQLNMDMEDSHLTKMRRDRHSWPDADTGSLAGPQQLHYAHPEVIGVGTQRSVRAGQSYCDGHGIRSQSGQCARPDATSNPDNLRRELHAGARSRVTDQWAFH